MNVTIPDHLEFTDWDSLTRWSMDNEFAIITPNTRQLHKIGHGKYPSNAFTIGQLASKVWMATVIYDRIGQIEAQGDIAYLGCWIGLLAPWLSFVFHAERVFGFDTDPEAIDMADDYNSDLVEADWRFKGVVDDATMIDWSDPEFVVEGELITDFFPNVIVNTSCEHMTDDWFNSASENSLVIMQTNNYFKYHEHINCVDSLKSMEEQYPMKNVIYSGEMITPAYTRYMQIGYPA